MNIDRRTRSDVRETVDPMGKTIKYNQDTPFYKQLSEYSSKADKSQDSAVSPNQFVSNLGQSDGFALVKISNENNFAELARQIKKGDLTNISDSAKALLDSNRQILTNLEAYDLYTALKNAKKPVYAAFAIKHADSTNKTPDYDLVVTKFIPDGYTTEVEPKIEYIDLTQGKAINGFLKQHVEPLKEFGNSFIYERYGRKWANFEYDNAYENNKYTLAQIFGLDNSDELILPSNQVYAWWDTQEKLNDDYASWNQFINKKLTHSDRNWSKINEINKLVQSSVKKKQQEGISEFIKIPHSQFESVQQKLDASLRIANYYYNQQNMLRLSNILTVGKDAKLTTKSPFYLHITALVKHNGHYSIRVYTFPDYIDFIK